MDDDHEGSQQSTSPSEKLLVLLYGFLVVPLLTLPVIIFLYYVVAWLWTGRWRTFRMRQAVEALFPSLPSTIDRASEDSANFAGVAKMLRFLLDGELAISLLLCEIAVILVVLWIADRGNGRSKEL